MNDSRPPFYLITGLLLGFALGYLISVVFLPAQYADGSPAQLTRSDKVIYRSMAAQAYAVSNNLERAAARIDLLGDANPGQELAAEAQRLLAEGKPLAEAEILARLASALQQPTGQEAVKSPGGTDIPLFTPDPALKTREAVSEASATPSPQAQESASAPTNQPTPSPAPTLGAPFELAERLIVCQPDTEPALIEVQVEDHSGAAVAGVKVDISWQDGEEYFFTGLIQSVNSGYADYKMAAGVEYALRVGEGGEQVREVNIPECTQDNGEKYPGSVYLRFTQP